MIILSLSSFSLNFETVPTVWYFLFFISFSILYITGCSVYNFCDWILKLVRQCGIFCFSYHFLYSVTGCSVYNFCDWFLKLFLQCGIFYFSFHFLYSVTGCSVYNFCDLILELFRQCGIFRFSNTTLSEQFQNSSAKIVDRTASSRV
jgi:hypothetical protein